MATYRLPALRLIVAGGFAVAVAVAPVIVSNGGAATPLAACPRGQSPDPYTYSCTPDVGPFPGGAGAQSEQALTACSGRNPSDCVTGDEYASPPVQMPNTKVHQSP
jgi:hypothetical protein